MSNDNEIGRVVAVDTAQLTIELNPELKALTRSTYEGVEEVARINSYVVLPVGARRIVAMVTRVFLTEEAELGQGKAFITLPSPRRLMKATMIGTIEGDEFHQGISLFPVLDNPVLLAAKSDLDVIFERVGSTERISPPDPKKPGFCVPIGISAIFEDYRIQINPDAFFGKHAAVIGSTGSGKSCTIASILQSILQRHDVKQTRFIVLDTNGEYRSAFQTEKEGVWSDIDSNYRCLYIPTDPLSAAERLIIPYWFMNSDDFVRLFRAQPGVQRPVLMEALKAAREPAVRGSLAAYVRDLVTRHVNRLLDLSRSNEKTTKDIRDLAIGTLSMLSEPSHGTALSETLKESQMTLENFNAELSVVKDEAEKHVGKGQDKDTGQKFEYSTFVDAKLEDTLRRSLTKLLRALTPVNIPGNICTWTADSPAYFNKAEFRRQYIPQALSSEEIAGGRARDLCGTMLMRINRLLDDRRFEFLFGSVNGAWPEPAYSLATFLRDILGIKSGTKPLSDSAKVSEGIFPFYDRQRRNSESHNIVIIDLSLLAAEVLENVTALLGRLILEFLQRASDKKDSGIERGEFPIVLVLEEAQNYIRQSVGKDDESISREVYERIAREGRKYGLGLVVASQRPSELSKTVLSQCSTFIVHRLQNPEDLKYFKEIVPGVYKDMLEQLPALSPQYALVLGEGVKAPSLLRVRNASPTPRSKDPRFFAEWTDNNPHLPDVEKVCASWEGKASG